ncbi:MAG: hypothetical protein QW101_06370 [Ignisphaera sp.]
MVLDTASISIAIVDVRVSSQNCYLYPRAIFDPNATMLIAVVSACPIPSAKSLEVF